MPRAKLAPQDVPDFFGDPKRRPSPYDIKYERRTYRVRAGTHSNLKDIAVSKGIGLNDLVRWVLDAFVIGYKDGTIILPIEEYVVTKSRLSE